MGRRGGEPVDERSVRLELVGLRAVRELDRDFDDPQTTAVQCFEGDRRSTESVVLGQGLWGDVLSEVVDGVCLTEATGERREEGVGESWNLGEQFAEFRAVDHQELHRFDGGDGGAAGLSVEQRHLAEHLAHRELGHLAVASRDARSACEDDHGVRAGFALGDDDLSLTHRSDFGHLVDLDQTPIAHPLKRPTWRSASSRTVCFTAGVRTFESNG